VLDLVQNSITADAKLIKILFFESKIKNKINITVADNGCGMNEETLAKAIDPFMTTKAARGKKIGLGLPFFKQLIESCEGTFKIKSKPGFGTVVSGEFPFNNIDQPPIGSMEEIVLTVVLANPTIDFYYKRKTDDEEIIFDTRPVRKMLGEDAVKIWQSADMTKWFKEQLKLK